MMLKTELDGTGRLSVAPCVFPKKPNHCEAKEFELHSPVLLVLALSYFHEEVIIITCKCTKQGRPISYDPDTDSTVCEECDEEIV